MGVFLYELADRLVAMVLESRVVSKYFVCDVLGNLLIHTRLALLIRRSQLVPLHLLLLPLQLLHTLCSLLAGD